MGLVFRCSSLPGYDWELWAGPYQIGSDDVAVVPNPKPYTLNPVTLAHGTGKMLKLSWV